MFAPLVRNVCYCLPPLVHTQWGELFGHVVFSIVFFCVNVVLVISIPALHQHAFIFQLFEPKHVRSILLHLLTTMNECIIFWAGNPSKRSTRSVQCVCLYFPNLAMKKEIGNKVG